MAHKISYQQKNAVYFDGSSSFATYTPTGTGIANLSPDPDEAFSVCFWALGVEAGDDNTWVGQFDDNNTGGVTDEVGWAVLSAADDTVQAHHYSRNGSANVFISASAGAITKPLRDGGWYHIASTYDGSADSSSLKIYINGVQMAGSTSIASGSVAEFVAGTRADTQRLAIAALVSQEGAELWGHGQDTTMCQVGIYNVELTAAQVSEIYNGGHNDRPGPYDLTKLASASSLVGCWLNDNSSDTSATLQDGTANNRDMTTTGVEAGYLFPVHI
jgi:hypothetical protein